VKGYLDINQPGKSWQDVLQTRTINPDILNIVPASLQFKVIAVTGEYTELPAELHHQVKFTAKADSNELFTITLDSLKLSNKSITLTYERKPSKTSRSSTPTLGSTTPRPISSDSGQSSRWTAKGRSSLATPCPWAENIRWHRCNHTERHGNHNQRADYRQHDSHRHRRRQGRGAQPDCQQ